MPGDNLKYFVSSDLIPETQIYSSLTVEKEKKRKKDDKIRSNSAVKECFGSWGKLGCHLCCELSSSYGQRGEHLGELESSGRN